MKSKIELQDSLFQLGQRDYREFVTVQNQRDYSDDNVIDNATLITVYLRFDNRYEIYERKVYSILDLLKDLGGLQRSLYIIGMILVNFFSYRMYISSILKHTYQIKNLKRDEMVSRATQYMARKPKQGGAS